MQFNYRPDIDGLRAIAVIAVVVFHIFPETLPGGYVGVDVFFVISGFLIASVIFRDSSTSKFSLRDFYARRIRRIFPALSIVLGSSLVAGWFLLVPVDFKNLGKHTIAGSSFISNLVLWKESGYFDTSAELKPLLHLWSLGVEEQFYIFFPLLLLLIRRTRISRTAVISFFLCSSLIASVIITVKSPAGAFYNPLTRIWEILIGVLVADLNTKTRTVVPSPKTQQVLSVSGIALILGAIAQFNDLTPFPSWRALIPSIGAALVIISGPRSFLNANLLSRRLPINIGLISYPLYLWHWPILVFARIKFDSELDTLARFSIFFISVGAAYLTFQILEKPLRFRLAPKKAVLSLSVLILGISLSGTMAYVFEGFPRRYSVEFQELVKFEPDVFTDALLGSCWIDQFEKPNAFDKSCYSNNTKGEHWLVWGDSHAARLTPGLRNKLGGEVQVSQLTRSSCPPIIDIEFKECQASNAYSMSLISKTAPDTVLMFGRWDTYLANNSASKLRSKLAETVRHLHRSGVDRILLLGPAPFWSGSLPTNMIEFVKTSDSKYLPERSQYRLDPIGKNSDKLLRSIAMTVPGIDYVSVYDILCESDGCLVTTDGTVSGLTTWDYGHLTTPGAEYVIERLMKTIG